MHVSVWLPLLGCVVLAGLARPLVRTVPPGPATRILTGIAVFGAASTVWSLLLLAIGGLGRVDEVQDEAHVSAVAVAAVDSVPRIVGVLAVLALAGVLTRASWVALAASRSRRAVVQALAGSPAGLVVLADPRPDAYAVAGPPGRIVVSAGMLAALDAAERRVLLAHERAHLAHHHHRHLLWTEIAAAFNPMFAPLRAAVGFHTERWADESAAAVTGREPTARALARAALTSGDGDRSGPGEARVGLAYVDQHVADRVRALMSPLPATRWSPTAPLALVALAASAALLDATAACHHLLELL